MSDEDDSNKLITVYIKFRHYEQGEAFKPPRDFTVDLPWKSTLQHVVNEVGSHYSRKYTVVCQGVRFCDYCDYEKRLDEFVIKNNQLTVSVHFNNW